MSGIIDPGDQKLVARLLNLVNDPAPGVPVSTAQASGSIIQTYSGMVGKRLVLTAAMASKLSDTSIGTLYEGIYQYVNVLSSATASPVRGALCYWSSYENYVVATDQVATNAAKVAGVFINVITKGNYGFIQIAGKSSILMKATITKATPADGDLVVADGATSPRGDVLADATALTSPTAKLILGVSLGAGVSNTISLVDLWNIRQVMGGLGGF